VVQVADIVRGVRVHRSLETLARERG
jgi:hypothetical protein